jgi:hypothetical protein
MHFSTLLSTSLLVCLTVGSIIPSRIDARDRADLPRLILYAQTHRDFNDNDKPVSLLPLLGNPSITHVYIAAFHINSPDTLVLNEHHLEEFKFHQLWDEKAQLQKNGIKVMAMLGGAAKGTYQRLSKLQVSIVWSLVCIEIISSCRSITIITFYGIC